MMKIYFTVLALTVCFGHRTFWNELIANMISRSKDILGEEHIYKAAIIAIKDGALRASWGYSNVFSINSTYGEEIARSFKIKDFTAGVRIGDVAYPFILTEGHTLFIAIAESVGEGPVILQASNTAIVIALSPKGRNIKIAKYAVEMVTEYLESKDL